MSLKKLFASLLGITLLLPTLLHAEKPKPLIWRGCGVSKKAFMHACARAYQAETGIPVDLSGGGATLGIEAVADGGADLGGTCRPCLPQLRETDLKIRLAIVAWDALAVVVHKENPVTNLTRDQLRDVFTQKIRSWNELGGSEETIVVVGRQGKTSGVGYSTRLLIFGDVDADYGRTVVRLNSSGPVEQLVQRQPRAIAVTGVSSARKRDLKILTIDGHAPTAENIAKGDYPYFRPLYIAYKPENRRAQQFVSWLLSEKGQAVVEAEGTVTLKQGVRLINKFRHIENTKQIENYEMLEALATKAEEK